MNLQYEKDNKERIPFEHYLEEFAKLDPEASIHAYRDSLSQRDKRVPGAHDAERVFRILAGLYSQEGRSC